MGNPDDSKSSGDAPEVEATSGISPLEHAYDLDEKSKISDYKADAIEAENAEHKMGVLEAVREYPMASFWAFVMSFTIVSCLSLLAPFHLIFSFPRTRNRS
jgi:MFS transporter, SP family, general alpha glucoside:H+ symporter